MASCGFTRRAAILAGLVLTKKLGKGTSTRIEMMLESWWGPSRPGWEILKVLLHPWCLSLQGVEVMRKFSIQYVHPRGNDCWIATDEPVVTMYESAENQGVGVGFTTPGVKVLMPLSSRVALLLGEDVQAADGEARGYIVRGL